MPRFPGHFFVQLLRSSVSALLLLAALVNPVLAGVADSHESAHGGTLHQYDAGDHESGSALDEEDDEGSLLHALMHASHCCGHLTAILSSAFVSPVVLLADILPAQEFAAPYLHIQPNHFRPPIAV